MKNTNNNGTKMANNNETTAQLQTINLEENVKFSEIPAIYNFENFSIFVERKQTGKTHGEKTLYFGTISNNETTETTEMDGFDITKIKKLVNCNFKRVYISNMDGTTVPKCKNLTDENINSMVQSMQHNVNKTFCTLYTKLEPHTHEDDLILLQNTFDSILQNALKEYENTLKTEQLKISIENKTKENKKLIKQYQKEMLEAIQSMDFAKMQDLANKIKDLEKSKTLHL